MWPLKWMATSFCLLEAVSDITRKHLYFRSFLGHPLTDISVCISCTSQKLKGNEAIYSRPVVSAEQYYCSSLLYCFMQGSHPTALGMFHSAILGNRRWVTTDAEAIAHRSKDLVLTICRYRTALNIINCIVTVAWHGSVTLCCDVAVFCYSEENLESCSTCGEFSSSLKNCSKCRQVGLPGLHLATKPLKLTVLTPSHHVTYLALLPNNYFRGGSNTSTGCFCPAYRPSIVVWNVRNWHGR